MPPPIPPNIQEFAAPQVRSMISIHLRGLIPSPLVPSGGHLELVPLWCFGSPVLIFLLETLQTALSGADLYYWFAAGFGDAERLATPYASAFDTPIMGSVVSLTVQFFFVYRIWVLSKKRWWLLCVIICLVSIVGAVGAFTGGTYTHVRGKFASGRILKVLALTWLIGNTVSDLLIASAMLYHLSRIKAIGNLSGHALVSIVRLTVETNLVTTSVSIVSLLMVAVYPEKNWFVCPTYVLGKLYSNTLLVSLNNRISIRDTFGSREGIVNCSAATLPDSARSESTMAGMPMEIEKQQKPLMKHPLAEADTDVRVIIPSAADIA
ncbi:hypothetical protein DFH94DRAFT_687287 [Russula ochroleuca]|uniref:DUF6534 domain-containing protein n=1 Tax=Russula ochroleuca TaxID=152965 RepID=A0A9P5TDK6_9AGAM|nr:hypothetical protein DFH94DRAFT_687287 [Russula ochroleuca]